MTLTLYRDVWAMEPNPDRPAFPHPILVPPGSYEAVRRPSPHRCGGPDWLYISLDGRLAGMTEAGWMKKAGRPPVAGATNPEPESDGDWSF